LLAAARATGVTPRNKRAWRRLIARVIVEQGLKGHPDAPAILRYFATSREKLRDAKYV
jgi:hypothetical protein